MAKAAKRPTFNGLINRINKVGIELEGGWDVLPEGEHYENDGSVKFPQHKMGATFSDGTSPLANVIVLPVPAIKGEVVSRPIEVKDAAAWIAKCYPKYVNETCGLHVHMSFHYRLNYSRLMTPDFTAWMVKKVAEWAEAERLSKDHMQWNRLDPNHPWTLQHCSHQYLGEAQVKVGKKDYQSRGKPYSRYTFVNYCYGQRPTVEVRGLAMMETAEQATRAIHAVVDATNRFLAGIKQREKTTTVAVKPRPMADVSFGTYLRAA